MTQQNTYYKVLDENNQAQNGGEFDYTEYLPTKQDGGTYKPGKWLPKRETDMCKSGWHVTKHWNMWAGKESDNIYEVEMKNEVKDSYTGVEETIVCESSRLVKPVKPNYKDGLNTGDNNTGDWNTGDWNTGYKNTGHKNTGYRNTGHMNTGDKNTGYYNTGNKNTGYYNTGNKNTGDNNTGHMNTGDKNTGDWNTGNRHSGWFNTPQHEAPKLLFGKPYTGKKPVFPKWLYVDLPTEEKWIEAFEGATKQELQDTINLPNFDYEVFEQITGISKEDFEGRL